MAVWDMTHHNWSMFQLTTHTVSGLVVFSPLYARAATDALWPTHATTSWLKSHWKRDIFCTRVHSTLLNVFQAGWKSSGETRIEKKIIQKTPTILRLRPGSTKKNLLAKIIKFGCNPLHTEPVLQLTGKVERVRKRNGTTTSTYRRILLIVWKPSSPWSGKSTENHLAIPWKIWMWIWLLWECSWIPLFEQRFISEKTMTRNYITQRTISGTLWDKYFVKYRDWSVNSQKSLVPTHQRSLVWK